MLVFFWWENPAASAGSATSCPTPSRSSGGTWRWTPWLYMYVYIYIYTHVCMHACSVPITAHTSPLYLRIILFADLMLASLISPLHHSSDRKKDLPERIPRKGLQTSGHELFLFSHRSPESNDSTTGGDYHHQEAELDGCRFKHRNGRLGIAFFKFGPFRPLYPLGNETVCTGKSPFLVDKLR